MGSVRAIVLAVAAFAAAPAKTNAVDRWAPYIQAAAAKSGIPADWIRKVMAAESGGHLLLHGRPIVSRAGAIGLMQLMPGTWQDMRVALRLGPDPHAPADNILAGAVYLRRMYDRFGYPGLFAAYNAGPRRYAQALAGRSRLPAETRAYVVRITGASPLPGSLRSRPLRAPLIPAGSGRRSADKGLFVSAPGDGLFVSLSKAGRSF